MEFADGLVSDTGIDRVLLSGDFNAYEKEDPIDVLAAGYTDLGEATGKKSYAFDGAVGSLDHVFASQAAAADVTGTDIWNINSVESIALEYSRYNYNAVNLYSADPYRSSDHDPMMVGLDLDAAGTDPGTTPTPVPVPVPTPTPTPAPVPPVDGNTPPVAPVAPSGSLLTEASRGGVSAPASARAGETITVTVGTASAGDTVHVWLFSTPTLIGTAVVAADGTVRVTIPADTVAGVHRLAVTAADGSLIGWTPITITTDGQLAFTGASGLGAGAVVAFLLLAAGAGVLVVRRRRRTVAAE